MSNRSKKAGKAKRGNSKKKFSLKRPRLFAFLKNERYQKVLGLSLILFAAFAVVSFVSFLFTWKLDQDLVSRPFWDVFDPSIRVENWLGKLGAILSHQFMYKWFGLAAFIIPFLLFLAGVQVLFNSWLLPIKRTIRWSVMGLLWIPALMGTVFNTEYFFLSGGVGFQIVDHLSAMLGNFGATTLIIFTCLAFLVFTFNLDLNNILRSAIALFPKRSASQKTENATSAVNRMKNIDQESAFTPAPANQAEDLPLEGTTPLSTEVKHKEETPLESELSLDVPDPVESDPELSSDDFEVQIAEEDTTILSADELDEKVKEFGEYDPKLDLAKYELPPVDLLEDHDSGQVTVTKDELEENKNRIVETLSNYKIGIQSIKATIGPTVTLYELVPMAGVRISKIKNLEDDIALSLAALGIRIIAPIPGRGTIGIEVPNSTPQIVSMKTVLASDKFQNTDMALPIALGKTISNETFVTDLAKMPHLLMAGATGQGKSVGLNCVLASLLYKKHPSQVKFVLVDPKKVELTLFNKIERHFLAKLPDSEEAIITDTKQVVKTLNSLCIEMDARYELLKNAQVRNLKEYNAKFVKRRLNPNDGHRFLPYIVLVVDEFADLIMTAGREVETPIARLAQLARAIGIHLIIATQRPSVNIITGTIKANFPARLAFRVTSKIDSRTILDAGGADQLIGRGDMLLSTGSDLIRLQCAFVDTPEVESITEFIGSQRGYPEAFLLPEVPDDAGDGSGPIDDGDRDALFEDAARVVVSTQQGSTSLIQRKLRLGYNRAGRIVDQLEAAGILGPFEGSKARQVLVKTEAELEAMLNPDAAATDPSPSDLL